MKSNFMEVNRRKKKLFSLSVVSVVGVSLVLVGCAGPTPPEEQEAKLPEAIEWRLHTVYAETKNETQELIRFCEDVREKSNGRLVITLYPPGGTRV